MQSDVKVPVHPVRAEQLMILAEKWRCSSTEAIERLIRERISSGDLPDSTPGLEVAAFGNLVAFKIDFDRTPPMSWEQAMKIGRALDRLASGGMNGFKCAYSEDTSIVFARKTDSFTVTFSSPGDEKKKDVTATIIEDLARQFRTAALTAKANKNGNSSEIGRASGRERVLTHV